MYKPTEPKRRQFFKIATAGTVASAAGGLPMMFVPNAALAEDVLGSDTFATLVKIARDIFPHDRFDDSLYANAVGVYADQAKSDEGVKKLIQEGVAQADSIAKTKFGSAYLQIAKERYRVHVLQNIEATPFFKKIHKKLYRDTSCIQTSLNLEVS